MFSNVKDTINYKRLSRRLVTSPSRIVALCGSGVRGVVVEGGGGVAYLSPSWTNSK